MTRWLLAASFAVSSLNAHAQTSDTHAPPPPKQFDPKHFEALSWRNIGPNRGGRSIAVAGSAARPLEYYFGATGGGLWKTTDGGNEWAPVTDGQIQSSSVGAVAVAPSRPDVIYIGMGEVQLRGNVMQGDGVYKSTDAGQTWSHLGLEATRAIARVRVHPTDPDRVYVAALGDPTGPNEARGIYRSSDGGKTWDHVLFVSPRAGAVDLVLDPKTPDVLYASIWQVYRNAYQLWSGGPDSGLWKSTDGGETWTKLHANSGFANGELGKIGIDVSAADPNRLYAIVEAHDGGLYRSDDAGATWTHVNASRDLWQRSFYFNRVAADPRDPDRVYVLNFLLFASDDAGVSVEAIPTPHADHHDLWIDPNDPERMICANDGGGTVSTNRGTSWTAQDFPTAQMYHVNTTRDVPYHVVGAQQDNTTAAVPSLPDGWTVKPRGVPGDTYYAVGGGENAYVATHPRDPNVFFAGATNTLTRYDRATGEARDVQPYPRLFMGESSAELPERWNWVYPIVMTEDGTLYAGSQHVWRSRDEGRAWEKVSPDLTRADPETMGPSGGSIVLDQDGPEIYATVFTIAPSPLDARTVWVGSDDGLVHVTRDGGATWHDVTPPDMVPDTRVSLIEASPHDASTAYVAAKRNQMGDRAPYLWATDDDGQSWRRIENGIGSEDFVHAVREDPKRRGLLYAGTEHGIYVSFDDGSVWHSLSLDLPDVQVPDLVVEERDLVIATHGRSFYVLDDITPLRQMSPDIGSAHAFDPAPAVRRLYPANLDVMTEHAGAPLTIRITRGDDVVRELETTSERGLNRVHWDLRAAGATVFDGMILESPSPARGPFVPPGRYEVTISAGDVTHVRELEVRADPRLDVSNADLEAQYELACRVRDRVSAANEAVIEIRAMKAKLAEDGDPDGLLEPLSSLEAELYQVKNQSPKDKIAFPIKLNDRLAGLLWNLQRGDHRPNRAHYTVFEELSMELNALLDELEHLRSP